MPGDHLARARVAGLGRPGVAEHRVEGATCLLFSPSPSVSVVLRILPELRESPDNCRRSVYFADVSRIFYRDDFVIPFLSSSFYHDRTATARADVLQQCWMEGLKHAAHEALKESTSL